MTNHFVKAEQLLVRADECVVPQLTRNFIDRAAVHAQLAMVQAFEQAHHLPAASNGAKPEDTLAAYGLPVRVPTLETHEVTGDRL